LFASSLPVIVPPWVGAPPVVLKTSVAPSLRDRGLALVRLVPAAATGVV
jgi:hypothetical protein